MKLIKQWWLVFLIICILGALGYYFFVVKSTAEKKNSSVKVKRESLKESITLSGKIDADEKATLRFQTSGRLAWVGVREGDTVKKYQAIASLDQRELQKRLERDLNTFVQERMELDQARDNYKDMAITDAMKRVLSKNQYDLNNSILDVELKDITLKYAYLYSPIEGVVTKVVSPYAGVNVTPSQAEFEIVNTNTYYFSATADQTDVVKLQEKMTGDIMFDSYPEKIEKGDISFISIIPKEGETGTVYEVKIKLVSTSQTALRMGMTGDATFVVREMNDVLTLPLAYIKSQNGKKYVWIVENGKQKKNYVVIGDEIDSSVIIESGLVEGDQVYD